MVSATISISVAEVVYDIQNKTYLTGKSRADGVNHRQVAQMQANDDEDNLNQVLRSLQTALGNLRQEFGEWIISDGNAFSNQNLLPTTAKVTLNLSLPSNFNEAMLQSLTDSVHGYLVAFGISEWFVITNKADAQQYSAIAEDALKMVARALSQRLRPKRAASSGSSSLG